MAPLSQFPIVLLAKELESFLHGLLSKDPASRLDVSAAIRHPWATGSGAAPLRAVHRRYDGSGSESVGGCSSEEEEEEEEEDEEEDAHEEGGGEGGGSKDEDSIIAEAPCSQPPHHQLSGGGAFPSVTAEWRSESLILGGSSGSQPASLPGKALRRKTPPRQCSTNIRHGAGTTHSQRLSFKGMLAVPELEELQRFTKLSDDVNARAGGHCLSKDVDSVMEAMDVEGQNLDERVAAGGSHPGEACRVQPRDSSGDGNIATQKGQKLDGVAERRLRRRGRRRVPDPLSSQLLTQEELDAAISQSTGGAQVGPEQRL